MYIYLLLLVISDNNSTYVDEHCTFYSKQYEFLCVLTLLEGQYIFLRFV
jgi:hypothetical protein